LAGGENVKESNEMRRERLSEVGEKQGHRDRGRAAISMRKENALVAILGLAATGVGQAEGVVIWPPVCIQREMSSPRLETPKWT
jgi:hypothetical protein